MRATPGLITVPLVLALAVAVLAAAPALAADAGLRVAGPAAGVGGSAPAASSSPVGRVFARASVACNQGLVYDDGEADAAIRLTSGNGGALEADAVMRFDTGIPGALIEQICVCWNSDDELTSDFDHDLVFYDVAPNGQPGALLAVVPATAENVPFIGGGAPQEAFFDYDIRNLGIRANGSRIYAGVRWNGGPEGGSGLLHCIDQDGPGNQPMWFSAVGNATWLPPEDLFDPDELEPPTSLMVRLSATEDLPTCPQTPCVEDATTLCLNNGRFRVTADWAATNQGTSGPAMRGKDLTDDTGYFWFFNQANVEMVVKVLNACRVNDHYWVFAGGLTNVQVQMTVCDTEEGVQRSYFNPPNTAFQPIQDTNAFATCP